MAGDGWHRGVIGIVASKLVDAFHRPAIVLSIDGDIAHGSCRSIPSFNMLGGARIVRATLMTKFGGHKQAAGLTIETARIREFRARVNDHADDRLGPDDLRPRLWLDGPLAFRAINDAGGRGAGRRWRRSARAIRRPIFRTSRVEIVDGPRRLKERHLKMAFKQDGRVMRGIAWRASEREELRHRASRRHRPGVLARAGHLERRALPAALGGRFQGAAR